MELVRATRKKSKLRLNLSAVSGAGKTMSALLMAKGLVGDWEKIAVIDTESGSASLYSHLGAFFTLDLRPPFSPERYIEAINKCLDAGIECIILDSATHEWSGDGGCLQINQSIANSQFKGNTWAAWSVVNPRHDAFVSKILHSPAHFITCTRSKDETVMGDDRKVKKVGIKDIQRDGWEYELTVSLHIDRDSHKASAVGGKDRTGRFEVMDPFIITEKTGEMIRDWCNEGVDMDVTERDIIIGKLESALSMDELKSIWLSHSQTISRLSGKDQAMIESTKSMMKTKLSQSNE